MQYLNYPEYLNMGGELTEAAFIRQLDRACGIIRAETFGRIDNMSSVPQSVKACVRDLIELYDDFKTKGNITSKSQTEGNVSESESYMQMSESDIKEKALTLIHDYLQSEKDGNGTPLLYRGAAI